MDIAEKIREFTNERNWTEYRLVKESGLPASTIANIFHRGTTPGIATLEIICKTFGITLSQFFSEGESISLSFEQREMLECISKLKPEQKKGLLNFLKTLS